MKRLRCALLVLFVVNGLTFSQDAPKSPFTVRGAPILPGPQITPYLQYQIAQAWKLDERRHAEFSAVRTDQDTRKLQARLRENLLAALWHASAAVTWLATEQLKLIADTGIDRNTERHATDDPVFVIGGLIYSPVENFDLDLGYRTTAVDDVREHALLAGLTLRW